jgi:hypothetical protein
MSAKDKAKELVDTYRIMLMNSDTECGEEILCTVIAKSCALIAVDEIIELAYWEYMESMGEKEEKYWEEVKKEIELL